MSAFDLLSNKEKDRYFRESDAETVRMGKIARAILDEPGMVTRLAVYLNSKLPFKQRDDIHVLLDMKNRLRDSCETMVRYGQEIETRKREP